MAFLRGRSWKEREDFPFSELYAGFVKLTPTIHHFFSDIIKNASQTPYHQRESNYLFNSLDAFRKECAPFRQLGISNYNSLTPPSLKVIQKYLATYPLKDFPNINQKYKTELAKELFRFFESFNKMFYAVAQIKEFYKEGPERYIQWVIGQHHGKGSRVNFFGDLAYLQDILPWRELTQLNTDIDNREHSSLFRRATWGNTSYRYTEDDLQTIIQKIASKGELELQRINGILSAAMNTKAKYLKKL
jgi:hypothetical protein